jgi:hypothetical protein
MQVKSFYLNAISSDEVPERAIQTISNLKISMILHASMDWKDGIDASLWLQDVTYALPICTITLPRMEYVLQMYLLDQQFLDKS